MTETNYRSDRFLPEIIQQAIWPDTRCETAESLPAKATFAFFMPARLASRRPQLFSAPPLTDRDRMTLAAS